MFHCTQATHPTTMYFKRTSSFLVTPLLILLTTLPLIAECGLYHMMAEAMGWNDPWESKGVTFGIKSKGMTAIIPIPLPIPIFKKKDMGGGSSGGGDTKGTDNGGGGGGGWEQPAASNDWW